MVKQHMSQPKKTRLKTIKKVIAIGSGKGGVGKSTTAIHLALAWHQQNIRVGLLDADIYGPNQPKMLGTHGQLAPKGEDHRFLPLTIKGIHTMSIAYLVDPNTPMVLRGPMISKLMEQMLFQTHWPPLDLLVIDLPPGTGDIQLSLSQKIHLDGAVIVSTPQEVALLDARKAIEMFRKVHTPVLGLIENMSTYTCSMCGHEEALFGKNGAKVLADAYDLPFLGSLPISTMLQKASDKGEPIVESHQTHPISKLYYTIAQKISDLMKKDSAKFPNIIVE